MELIPKFSQMTLENAITKNLGLFLKKTSNTKIPEEVKIQVTHFLKSFKTVKINTSKILYARYFSKCFVFIH